VKKSRTLLGINVASHELALEHIHGEHLNLVQVGTRFLNGRRRGPQFADEATASGDQLDRQDAQRRARLASSRDADAQGQARRYQTAKNRRAWDVGSRNAADSATLAARASETTRVVTGAGVLRPKHVAAVTDALMYEHRLNTIVTCSCCDCRISVVNMDGAPFQTRPAPGVHAAARHRRAHVAPDRPGPLGARGFRQRPRRALLLGLQN